MTKTQPMLRVVQKRNVISVPSLASHFALVALPAVTCCCAGCKQASRTLRVHVNKCMYRFLSIAQHMLTKRAPRVTHVQDCCWCGCGFTELLKDIDSADHRVRHRKNCLAATIVQLQSDADHDITVSRLTDIWNTDLNDVEVASPSSSKRAREPAFSPIVAAALNFSENFAALNAFAADENAPLSAFAAHDAALNEFAADDDNV